MNERLEKSKKAVPTSGWIKLYRSIFDSVSWRSLTLEGRIVMIAILCGCSYRESEVVVEGQRRTLRPGQWLTSIPAIQRLCGPGISRQNIRTGIKSLKSTGFLTNEVTDGNHRIITVLNWQFYQGNGELTDESTDDLTDASQTPNSIQEGIKNKKKKKNSFSDPFEPPETDRDRRVRAMLKEEVKNQ